MNSGSPERALCLHEYVTGQRQSVYVSRTSLLITLQHVSFYQQIRIEAFLSRAPTFFVLLMQQPGIFRTYYDDGKLTRKRLETPFEFQMLHVSF